MVKVNEIDKVSVLKWQLDLNFYFFMLHQANEQNVDKKNLKDGKLMFIVFFAENYMAKNRQEV